MDKNPQTRAYTQGSSGTPTHAQRLKKLRVGVVDQPLFAYASH